jgi:hypothetical protein
MLRTYFSPHLPTPQRLCLAECLILLTMFSLDRSHLHLGSLIQYPSFMGLEQITEARVLMACLRGEALTQGKKLTLVGRSQERVSLLNKCCGQELFGEHGSRRDCLTFLVFSISRGF